MLSLIWVKGARQCLVNGLAVNPAAKGIAPQYLLNILRPFYMAQGIGIELLVNLAMSHRGRKALL